MLQVYNTLTGKKEEFNSIRSQVVHIYVCGPTVYDYCHIGHARSIISFDVIRRYLEWKGFRVNYVQNFTDIDDKMIKRATREGITVFDLANRFIDQYYKDFDMLNVQRATVHPRATEHIDDMIKFIEGLIARGVAYVVDGNVYFSIETFPNYGALSHKNLEESFSGQEEEEERKKDPNDFVLWKKRKEGEPFWNSPWGPGRPGWHIECSTMAMKYLGQLLDIHGGGLDLVFPHHENEIAQSEALTGKVFVKYWVHNGFVTINKEKMSKSLGNFFTIEEVLKKYNPMVLRFFLISTHYRSPIDFNEEQIQQAEQRYKRFQLALAIARQFEVSSSISDQYSEELFQLTKTVRKDFADAMDDDFSTPRAIASVNQLVKYLNGLASEKQSANQEVLRQAHDTLLELSYVLGLSKSPKEDETALVLHNLLKFILELRREARKNKEYEIADRIRTKLMELGIELIDYPNKTIWLQS